VDCKKGFLELTLAGVEPFFKEKPVTIKRVPICACGDETAECSKCNQGYLTMTMQGLNPKFKEIEEVEPTPPNEKPNKDDKEDQPQGLGWSSKGGHLSHCCFFSMGSG